MYSLQLCLKDNVRTENLAIRGGGFPKAMKGPGSCPVPKPTKKKIKVLQVKAVGPSKKKCGAIVGRLSMQWETNRRGARESR